MKNLFTDEVIKKLRNEFNNLSLAEKVRTKKETADWFKNHPELHVHPNLSHSKRRKGWKKFRINEL